MPSLLCSHLSDASSFLCTPATSLLLIPTFSAHPTIRLSDQALRMSKRHPKRLRIYLPPRQVFASDRQVKGINNTLSHHPFLPKYALCLLCGSPVGLSASYALSTLLEVANLTDLPFNSASFPPGLPGSGIL